MLAAKQNWCRSITARRSLRSRGGRRRPPLHKLVQPRGRQHLLQLAARAHVESTAPPAFLRGRKQNSWESFLPRRPRSPCVPREAAGNCRICRARSFVVPARTLSSSFRKPRICSTIGFSDRSRRPFLERKQGGSK